MQLEVPSGKEPDTFLSSALNDRFLAGSRSPLVQALNRIIVDIAPTEMPVLLVGESGTGKEFLAYQIHKLSHRGKERFVKVSCSTLGPQLLDSLKEHEEGNGALSSAEAGTLYLDEITDLDLTLQRTLLNVLPDGDASPNEVTLRARPISSTTRNLEAEIRSGHFREELYYRLNGVCLRLPPLRQRQEDIPDLVDLFLTKYAAHLGRAKPTLHAETLSALTGYSWPGNIRQLENTVKRIVALGDERLALDDLRGAAQEPQVETAPPAKPFSLKQAARAASRQAERELILKALERTRWNRKRAARELQISYKTFLYKLKQIGVEESREPIPSTGESK